MEEFWILILVLLFARNSLDKAESVQLKELEDLPLQTFDEIFGEGWWDNDEAEDLRPPTNFGQNVHRQIGRQNTQLGQIEPNSTDQNPLFTESDHFGQIEPNSTDQNPPLTESDHFGQIEPNSNDQNPLFTESDHVDEAKNGEEIISNEKHKIVAKFHEIKDEFKQKGTYSKKEWNQIDIKIAKHLKVSRTKIYKWKKQFNLSRKSGTNYSDDEKLKIVKELMRMKSEHSGEDKKSGKEIDKEIAERFGVNVRKINRWKKKFSLSRRRNPKNEQKNLVEKFDQMKAELKRAGLKNSYPNQINETVAKELGLGFMTIYRWKRKLGQTTPNGYPHSEQKKLLKLYYEIKGKTPKTSDEDIAKILKIGRDTLYKWKRQFKRQQLDANSENFGPEGFFG